MLVFLFHFSSVCSINYIFVAVFNVLQDQDLYFTDPKQLLDIYTELEEQNLSLILNSQETEEAVEEIKQAMATAQHKMNCETDFLKQQLNMLNEAVAKEESRAAELELKAKMFSFSQSTIEDQVPCELVLSHS
ncbi:hypothetical protein scyTo_0024310 [Scyliorhinus torazame]|uniref:Uncharacterized protein n=1 Tax=Scyliorhinus torazame TaxID=75743 RepID=A0A401QEC8_SCYTO|nr:hypothetical protein [Scyliorhinus torazame]